MVKRAAQAWAFAAILLLPNYIDLASGAGDARMRSPVPLTRIALAHLTDIDVYKRQDGCCKSSCQCCKHVLAAKEADQRNQG